MLLTLSGGGRILNLTVTAYGEIMRIEVDIDDTIIDVHKRIFGPDFDMASFLSEIAKTSVVLLATHPDEMLAAFDRKFLEGMPPYVQEAYKRLVFRFCLPPKEAS